MNIFITGANSGIGLELARIYTESAENKVYALCRQTSDELDALDNLTVLTGLELTDHLSIDRVLAQVSDVDVDLLINCAGIFSNSFVRELNYEDMQQQFAINAVGPLKISTSLLGQMTKGSKVIMLTSRMGSIEDNTSGGYYAYRMSKVALNMGAVSLAQDLAELGIVVGIVHPGFVKTKMTGFNGDVSPEQSAEAIVARITDFNAENSGSFVHAQGQALPW